MTGLYLGVFGIAAIAVWWFVFGGSVITADFFYSDGFTVDSNFERNIIPLSEMTIDIDPDFNATFVNRMNYYHGLSIGVFDGQIYSMLNNRQVRLISSLDSYEVIYPTTERMQFDQIYISNDVLYYTRPRGHFERYKLKQDSQYIPLAADVTAFILFDEFLLHRIHAWDYFRHQEFPRVDGNIYQLNLENGDSEIWLEDRAREFFADVENDRITFAVRSNIWETDLARTSTTLVTDNFLHYNRLNPQMEYGWMHDGNRVLWVNSKDWTGIESSLFSFNFDTQEEEYLGRIPNASKVNVINDYVLVSTTAGHLYLIDIDAKHRNLLSNDVSTFAVVGNLIFYQQIGTRNIYVMDLNGNFSLFDI